MNVSKVSLLNNQLELEKKGRTKPGNVISFSSSPTTGASCDNNLLNAMRSLGQVRHAQTISFTGIDAFSEFRKLNTMTACANSVEGIPGEEVGQHIIVSKLVDKMAKFYDNAFPQSHSAIKTTLEVNPDKKGEMFTQLRSELLLQPDSHFSYSIDNFGNMPKGKFCSVRTNDKPVQTVSVDTVPGLKNEVTILQIKDKLTPVIRERKNVLLVANGELTSKLRGNTTVRNKLWDILPESAIRAITTEGSELTKEQIQEIQKNDWSKIKPEMKETLEKMWVTEEKIAKIAAQPKGEFKEYKIENIPKVVPYETKKSEGKGAVVTIGLQEGRFCKEIVASLVEFEKKVNKGLISLPPFVAQDGASKMGILMLSGGFGSRAEYTNASADAIYNSDENAANNTKGSFVTPTGLTPMETSLVSLHLAGILDCSKGEFQIGKNLKFYMNMNEAGNFGNGGFTLDMKAKVGKKNEDFQLILPNDSLSRMPEALKTVNSLMNEGNTAIAMIAKEVPMETARGTFGIMKLSDDGDNRITEFAEKPKDDDTLNKYATDGNCLANTFQFAVSNEAFAALNHIFSDPHMIIDPNNKDAKDWSSHLVPTIMVLSMYDKASDMIDNLAKVSGKKELAKGGGKNFLETIPEEVLLQAREMLKKNGEIQQIRAVPTPEFWYDVGQLPELYEAITEIARDNDNVKMLPWERKNVIDCVNPKTGLIASTSAQKAEIESLYDVKGKVYATTKSKKISPEVMTKYDSMISKLTKADKEKMAQKSA